MPGRARISTSHPVSRLLVALVALVGLCAAAYGSYVLLRASALARTAATWTEVQGVIVSSDGRVHGTKAKSMHLWGEYTYAVGGQTYRGTRLGPIRLELKPGPGRQLLSGTLAQGAQIPVRFDPADPSVSMAVIGVTSRRWMSCRLMVGIGAAFVLGAAIIWWSGRPGGQRQ